MDNLALEVIGQNWSGEVVSLSLFLEDWELGRVALSCHMAVDFSCQEMSDACRRAPLFDCVYSARMDGL